MQTLLMFLKKKFSHFNCGQLRLYVLFVAVVVASVVVVVMVVTVL